MLSGTALSGKLHIWILSCYSLKTTIKKYENTQLLEDFLQMLSIRRLIQILKWQYRTKIISEKACEEAKEYYTIK